MLSQLSKSNSEGTLDKNLLGWKLPLNLQASYAGLIPPLDQNAKEDAILGYCPWTTEKRIPNFTGGRMTPQEIRGYALWQRRASNTLHSANQKHSQASHGHRVVCDQVCPDEVRT